jgi:phosphatidylserine/phosphatidylglycerophosphate/cardiolipin synthase-like enzyme
MTLLHRPLLIVALLLALAGCAGLPSQVQRPVSSAAAPEVVAATTLARIAADSAPAQAEGQSGLRLLPDGDQAFDARISLARSAEKTIDAQYYLIASDTTGLQFLRELRDAAARGVRVRLLVDDLYAVGQDELFAGLASHPNVEVRLFNPLPVREGSFASRIVFSLHQVSRINRRMHNKLFVVDNSFAIAGGRNIADEYFGRAEPANFIDMDVLVSGAAVQEMSTAFDAYWNSEHVYPVQSLVGSAPAATPERFEAQVAAAAPVARLTNNDSLGQAPVATQIAAGRVAQSAGSVRVLADAPSKIDSTDGSDGAVMRAHLELIRSAQSEVLIASPYFVPGERGVAAMQQAVDRQVRLSVMTNSLATTDEPLVHYGYAKYRQAMVKMGASVYELMPGAQAPQAAESSSASSGYGASGLHGSLGRLHAKVAVIDQQHLYIGSMNMDRRSAHSTTEIGLIIDSTDLARDVTRLLQREQAPRSYRLQWAAADQRIEWVGAQPGGERVFTSEPGAAWSSNLTVRAVGLLVGEEML